MSIVSFKHLSPEETLKQSPAYCREDIQSFLILKGQFSDDALPVGLYALLDRGLDQRTGKKLSEAFLTIFPPFRFKVFNKVFLQEIFTQPFRVGFDAVYTWTYRQSWVKLFARFKPLGIRRLETPPPWDEEASETPQAKIWFMREKEA